MGKKYELEIVFNDGKKDGIDPLTKIEFHESEIIVFNDLWDFSFDTAIIQELILKVMDKK